MIALVKLCRECSTSRDVRTTRRTVYGVCDGCGEAKMVFMLPLDKIYANFIHDNGRVLPERKVEEHYNILWLAQNVTDLLDDVNTEDFDAVFKYLRYVRISMIDYPKHLTRVKMTWRPGEEYPYLMAENDIMMAIPFFIDGQSSRHVSMAEHALFVPHTKWTTGKWYIGKDTEETMPTPQEGDTWLVSAFWTNGYYIVQPIKFL